MSTARLSQFNETLTDSGPTSARRQPSRASVASSTASDDQPAANPAYLSAFHDLRPNRSSLVSLREAEYGWAGSASAVTAATKDGRKLNDKPRSFLVALGPRNAHAQAARAPYRPPFAPDPSSLDTAPLVASNVTDKPLTRGRSLKEKIQGVMRSPSRSPRAADAPLADVCDGKPEVSFGEIYLGGSSPPRDKPAKPEGFVDGVVRRLSRRTTSRKPREPDYTVPSQEELDNILLYAAPPEAKIKNPPMLSSYPPRAPLRPRSATEGANLRPTPSISVGQARMAYSKSLRRPRGQAADGDKAYAKDDIATLPRNRSRASSAVSSLADEPISMRSSKPRRSRQVPDGWQPANAFVEAAEEGSKPVAV